MIEGDQAAEDGFLPDGETDTVTVLEGERSFLIGEPEFFRLWPELDDVSGGTSSFMHAVAHAAGKFYYTHGCATLGDDNGKSYTDCPIP